MIEWIKFKGSTEEEKLKEIGSVKSYLVFTEDNRIYWSEDNYENYYFGLNQCHYWATLNLPQEEKLERKCDYDRARYSDYLGDFLNQEFDNIYSILNELRKRWE